jgi:hypothetical protein
LTGLLLEYLPSNSLQTPLKEIESELDRIIRTLNLRGCIAKGTLVEWEKNVDLFQETFKRQCAKKELKILCGKMYSEVLRKAEIRELYFHWEGVLEKESQCLLQENFHRDTIWYALKIKELFAKKNAFFRQFFSKGKDKKRAITACCSIIQGKIENFDVQCLLRNLNEQTRALRARIVVFETLLVQPIGYTSNFASGLIHLLTNNLYTKNAAFLIESQERATQMPGLQKIALLSRPLQNSYLTFSKAMTSAGLLILDIAEWKWAGVSHRMLYTISQKLMPDSRTYITGFQRLGADEKTALLWLPTVSRALEFTVFAAVSGYSIGFSTGSMGGIALSYGIGKGASVCVGQAVDLFYQTNKERSPTYPLVHGLAQWMVFPLTHRYILPYILEQGASFFLSSQELFENEATCFANLAACRKEACKFLDLEETATIQEIRKAYRQLALQYHPDHNPLGVQMFRKATLAKKVCSST